MRVTCGNDTARVGHAVGHDLGVTWLYLLDSLVGVSSVWRVESAKLLWSKLVDHGVTSRRRVGTGVDNVIEITSVDGRGRGSRGELETV